MITYFYTIFVGYESAPETNIYLVRSHEKLAEEEVWRRFLETPMGGFYTDDTSDEYEDDTYYRITCYPETRIWMI